VNSESTLYPNHSDSRCNSLFDAGFVILIRQSNHSKTMSARDSISRLGIVCDLCLKSGDYSEYRIWEPVKRDRSCSTCYLLLEALGRCIKDLRCSSDSSDSFRLLIHTTRGGPLTLTPRSCAVYRGTQYVATLIFGVSGIPQAHRKGFQVQDEFIPIIRKFSSLPMIQFKFKASICSAKPNPCTPTLGGIFGLSQNISDLSFPADSTIKWINHCVENHTNCRRPERVPLPRRVVDVGYRDAYLLESSGQYHDYAALSHCWKDSVPLKTTRANLRDHYKRLVWNDLPVAFQEAIDMIRTIGMRYIWIDALCIIQDDEEEWEIESARMASIFENAKVTFALYQPGPNRSVFPLRKSTFTLPFYSTSANIEFHLYDSKIDQLTTGWTKETRLSERGWCFQASFP
jgi:heterokaryon incompatibility protein (HET)